MVALRRPQRLAVDRVSKALMFAAGTGNASGVQAFNKGERFGEVILASGVAGEAGKSQC